MHASEVDRVLSQPVPEVADGLLGLKESQWFERKSGRIQARDLAVPLVAFANAEGGTVVVGLSDGTVDGVAASRVNELRQVAQDFTDPTVRVRVDEISVPGSSGVVLVFYVAPGDHVHATARGDCYLRVGDESRKLGFAHRQELEFDRGPAPFDGTPVNASVGDLEGSQVSAYQHSLNSTSPEYMLRARSLLTRGGELTAAAYLLFASQPQELFPSAYVRVLRYLSNRRGSGANLNLDDEGDIRCEGSIPAQIEGAARAIEARVPKRRALTSAGVFRGIPIVPRDAWLEGLVNAVVHRSYSISGDHVRVEIFPDRIEITSPGRFPGLVNPANPLAIGRHARNPRIARVCSDLGITQELGEGIRRIFEEMRRVGLEDPLYAQSEAAVRLTLSSADAVPPQILATLPEGARIVLASLRLAGRPLGTGQVAELADLARPTTIRRLKALRGARLVVWEGQSPKDPRATWRVR